ncbi:MAG: MATE family efflux transporter [Clostridia bacterium]|nr:MATE family efflux transporter [Clostridia bacterium]
MALKTNSIDMIHGSLWTKILKFACPLILTSFLQQMYSAADVIVVGRFAGQEALAGVGTCTAIFNLFLNFIMGFSAGATIVLGQAIGADDREGIEKVTHTALAIAISCGLIICIVCLLFTKELLHLIDVPQNVMSEAAVYLRIVAVGYIPLLIYNFGAAILRAKGDTKRSLYIVTISGIINVILNLFFVCVLNMSADGVALATVISHIFTATAMMYILCNEIDETRISLRKIRFYKEPVLKIIRFGLPSGIQSSVYSISNILVQSSVNSFGSAAIAGSAATSSITEFYNAMSNGMYQASIVFASQNFGAKKFERIKNTIWVCMVYVFAIWAIQSAITFFFGEFLIGLYAPNDSAVIEIGMRKFNIMGYTYGIAAMMNVMSGVLRGVGASFINMVTSIVGVCGIRIIWILTAFKAMGTFESLFLCYPLSWLGTIIMHTIMFIVVFKKEKRLYLKEGKVQQI